MAPLYVSGNNAKTLLIPCWYECRHIVEFKGVGCMEPHTPESMTSSLYIVQEFMSGDTLKVQCCTFARLSLEDTLCTIIFLAIIRSCAFVWMSHISEVALL